ncbi:MAG: hypothetical protein ACFFCS_29950 [Candidatus Hodarchaeota archaeon]
MSSSSSNLKDKEYDEIMAEYLEKIRLLDEEMNEITRKLSVLEKKRYEEEDKDEFYSLEKKIEEINSKVRDCNDWLKKTQIQWAKNYGDEVVYTTNSGTLYHEKDCKHLKRAQAVFEILESKAIADGLKRCSGQTKIYLPLWSAAPIIGIIALIFIIVLVLSP